MTTMEQKDLFGNPVPPPRKTSTTTAWHRHQQMLRLYGELFGARCGTCMHLERRVFAKTYFKCTKSGLANGAGKGSDWGARWQACMMWEEGE